MKRWQVIAAIIYIITQGVANLGQSARIEDLEERINAAEARNDTLEDTMSDLYERIDSAPLPEDFLEEYRHARETNRRF